MGIVVSMLMITVGAIMRFAVSATSKNFNVHTVGVILMVVGILGAILSIAFWASWGGFNRRPTIVRAPGTVIEDHTVVRERNIR